MKNSMEAKTGEQKQIDAVSPITVDELYFAIRKKDARMEEEDARALAWYTMNFLGFQGRYLDKSLKPEDREFFNRLYDMGLAKTESEEGEYKFDIKHFEKTGKLVIRKWKIVYWVLDPYEIRRVIEESEIGKTTEKRPQSEEEGQKSDEEKVYDENLWRDVEKVRAKK